MQAMSLAVHIPLVCFGIAFPAIVLFIEGLYLRTGDPMYKALAKRWSKVMILFAVGVVTGTILSFEFGLLWPNFMATFGEVFGLAFTLEGISFFVEGIFIAIYVYGWDRMSPRRTSWTGIPIASRVRRVADGDRRQRLDERPDGFASVGGRGRRPAAVEGAVQPNIWHELIHMYLAGYLVGGLHRRRGLRAGVAARRRPQYERTALVITLTIASLAAPVQIIVGDWAGREVAERQPVKLAAMEGLQQTQEGAPFTLVGFYDATAARSASGSGAAAAVAAGRSTIRTHEVTGSTRCRRATARRSTSCASRSRR